jgi:hypothetical protein
MHLTASRIETHRAFSYGEPSLSLCVIAVSQPTSRQVSQSLVSLTYNVFRAVDTLHVQYAPSLEFYCLVKHAGDFQATDHTVDGLSKKPFKCLSDFHSRTPI